MKNQKNRLICLLLGASLTMSLTTSFAQVKSDTVIRNQYAPPPVLIADDNTGLIDTLADVAGKLSTDTASIKAISKAIAVIAATPKENTPAAWVGYIFAIIGVAAAAYHWTRAHLFKQALAEQGKPAVMNAEQFASKTAAEDLFAKGEHPAQQPKAKMLTFTPMEIKRLRNSTGNVGASDADFAISIKRIIDYGTNSQDYAAKLNELYAALTYKPEGGEAVSARSQAAVKRSADQPRTGGKFASKLPKQ